MKNNVVVLGLTLGLTACGGGGGGSSTSANSVDVPYKTDPVAMSDETSAETTAKAAFGTDDTLDELGTSLGSLGISKATEAGDADGFDPVALYSALKDRFGSQVSSKAGVLAGVTETVSETCQAGGSVSGTVNYATREQISAGDSMDLTFSSCGITSYLTWNGRITINFVALSGDPSDSLSDSSSETSIAFVDLTMVDSDPYSGGELLMDGAMTMGETYVASTDSTTSTLKGSKFRFKFSQGTQTADILLSDFDITNILDSDSNTRYRTSSDVNYTIATPELGGAVTIDTLSPFNTAEWGTYPYEGAVVITGAQGANVKLTALDETNVTLEYDLDGDGVYGPADADDPEMKPMTWADL